MSQESDLKDAIKDGDETKIKKAYKALSDSYEASNVGTPRSLDQYRREYS